MKWQKILKKVPVYLFLIAFFALSFFPVLFTFMSSFKSNMEILTTSNTIFPKKFVFENYTKAWQMADFSTYTKNRVFLSFFCVLGAILSSTCCGYAFSRGKFRGKEFFYYLMISSMFVSLGTLTLYPLLMIMKVIHLNKSLWGVIIIRVFGMNVTNLFIARGYISTIPTEIDEAAKIDGCSFFRIYYNIIFPLCKPLIATVAILAFRSSWNDYMLPLLCLNRSNTMWTLTLFQKNYQGEFNVDYNLSFACMVLCCLPVVVGYIVMQKQIIGGLTSGAVKG